MHRKTPKVSSHQLGERQAVSNHLHSSDAMIMPSVLIDLCCSLFILNHPEVLMNLGKSELESNSRILRHLRLLFFRWNSVWLDSGTLCAKHWDSWIRQRCRPWRNHDTLFADQHGQLGVQEEVCAKNPQVLLGPWHWRRINNNVHYINWASSTAPHESTQPCDYKRKSSQKWGHDKKPWA